MWNWIHYHVPAPVNSSLLKENHKHEEADGSSECSRGIADLHTFSTVWAHPQQHTPVFQFYHGSNICCRSTLFTLLLTQNPESISLLAISSTLASVLHSEVFVTAGSGRIQDELWQNPTIISISQKYNLSFYQEKNNTGCNTVQELHRKTANALRIQVQMNLGLWTSSCNAETVTIWSLEESNLVS